MSVWKEWEAEDVEGGRKASERDWLGEEAGEVTQKRMGEIEKN